MSNNIKVVVRDLQLGTITSKCTCSGKILCPWLARMTIDAVSLGSCNSSLDICDTLMSSKPYSSTTHEQEPDTKAMLVNASSEEEAGNIVAESMRWKVCRFLG